MKTIIVSIFYIVALLGVSGCSSTPEDVDSGWSVTSAKDATFKVIAFDEEGEAISTGSAFKVNDFIVSAAHVILGANSVEIYDSRGRLAGKTDSVRYMDAVKDIVILDIEAISYQNLETENGSVVVGSDVWAVGAPMGLDGTISKGVVSSVREDDVGKKLQFTAPVSPGSSGGPVLNSEGRVIGMTIATVEEGQNLNFAISAEHISALTRRMPSVKRISELKTGGEDDKSAVFVEMALGFAGAEQIYYGSRVSGKLEDGDAEVNGFWDFYKFSGEKGDIVNISLYSRGAKIKGSIVLGSTVFTEDVSGLEGKNVGDKNVVYTNLPQDDEYYLIVSSVEKGKADYRFDITKENKDSRYGEQWVYVSHDDTGDYFYIHEDVVQAGYEKKYVWTLTEKDGFDFIDDRQYNAILIRFALDCRQQKVKPLTITHRLDGDVVESEDIASYANWESVIPQTNGYMMYSKVCQ